MVLARTGASNKHLDALIESNFVLFSPVVLIAVPIGPVDHVPAELSKSFASLPKPVEGEDADLKQLTASGLVRIEHRWKVNHGGITRPRLRWTGSECRDQKQDQQQEDQLMNFHLG